MHIQFQGTRYKAPALCLCCGSETAELTRLIKRARQSKTELAMPYCLQCQAHAGAAGGTFGSWLGDIWRRGPRDGLLWKIFASKKAREDYQKEKETRAEERALERAKPLMHKGCTSHKYQNANVIGDHLTIECDQPDVVRAFLDANGNIRNREEIVAWLAGHHAA